MLAEWGVFALRALADGIGLLSVAVLRLSSVCSLTGLSVHLVWLDVSVCSVLFGLLTYLASLLGSVWDPRPTWFDWAFRPARSDWAARSA